MSDVLIIEARYYETLSDALLEGARAVLDDAGKSFEIVTVPGALEIPAVIAMAEAGGRNYEAYVALGCVIRGETFHFDIVSVESSRGLTDLAVGRGLAIGNGILTVENEMQAWARARPSEGDKGGFAARAALAMAEIKRRMQSGK